ncbi:putative RiPP precursor [Mesorhizobium sp. CU2]|nr:MULTISPECIES: putative RiPP precursor [unclassified Mesorhizobium]TPN89748.1 putative RiPP precursor [Mesorhizobium sp. CU3]TPO06651.1 putative RiPP precursor [Mesorhizobium sp. CU2]
MKSIYEKPMLVKREKLSTVVAGAPSGPTGPKG